MSHGNSLFSDTQILKESQYFALKEFSQNLNHVDRNNLSMLHQNIRYLQKTFDILSIC